MGGNVGVGGMVSVGVGFFVGALPGVDAGRVVVVPGVLARATSAVGDGSSVLVCT